MCKQLLIKIYRYKIAAIKFDKYNMILLFVAVF